WREAGSRAARVKTAVRADYATQRSRHWQLLQERDGLSIREWMPEPI
ncbi:MAG: hypothetical protein QOE82_2087, partial [Thermoanaerobaculia bacterium]|nr:hypothetical protein [Thermoanaerobaculia bacterium]